MKRSLPWVLYLTLLAPLAAASATTAVALQLNARGYFEGPGVNVLAYSNAYDGAFSDAKISSIELIQQGVRTATNGDVRLSATPGQWDPVPQLVSRIVDRATQTIRMALAYPDYQFAFTLEVAPEGDGVSVAVRLTKPLPAALRNRAGLNLEFLPAAYFHHAYLADGRPGTFPLHPSSDMQRLPGVSDARTALAARDGRPALAAEVAARARSSRTPPAPWHWRLDPPAPEPRPLATAHILVLAPEDPARRVRIDAGAAELRLYDGRNTASNGWFVVRTLIPADQTGVVVRWHVAAAISPGWVRPPVIAHSQLGYAPDQPKVAVLELDPHAAPAGDVQLLRIDPDGGRRTVLNAAPRPWGRYLRYDYATFDFSAVRAPGLYALAYGGVTTAPFRIDARVYDGAWHPTLDVYLPVAMDHMSVKEAYRVWHGEADRDDALQAPPNYQHFDLYAQGPSTDTPFKAGQHIPGLAIGGWFDAGDFDIRTQTQYAVVRTLVDVWERFGLKRDETTVDEQLRHVELHLPDGVPDVLEQIEHGTLQLVAQFHATGHAICGIIDPVLSEYTHVGDAASKTDGLVYDPALKPRQRRCDRSGTFDDRWAFTTHTSALNYGSIAALAAASRALRGYRDALAADALAIATRTWAEEHQHPPAVFRYGNTTGGPLEVEEFNAAVELLITTRDPQYAAAVNTLWPEVEKPFALVAATAVEALPYMDAGYARKLRDRTRRYVVETDALVRGNPFGVPISTGGWAGDGQILGFAINQYLLHKAFPDLVGRDAVYRGFNYLLGCHPGSDISFVSGVGTVSKEVAYGNNRADFSFIAGGIVPGVLVLKPDFPENKEDWPYLWGENEYVVNLGPMYIYLANAVRDLVDHP